ncbi:MAG TPA: LamG domain-containing protein [Polyangia bacterium]|nr:LamG domain-containing protein [Polyangia bacterium]
MRVALQSGGVTIDSVHYVVQSSASPPAILRSGDVDVSDANAAPVIAVSLPPGSGYTVVLTADVVPATGNPSFCSGTSQPFLVAAGQETAVPVGLICGGSMQPTLSGPAIINGNVTKGDNCPVLTSWTATPLQVSAPGGQIAVSAAATDADASETLTYVWTATAGSFAAPTSTGMSGFTSSTQYVCAAAGTQTLTVTVTDDHVPSSCSASQTLKVDCKATTVCESLVLPASGAEAAAPPLAADNPTGDFTVEGWVYPTSFNPDYSTVAAHWDTRANGTASYALQYDPAGKIVLAVSSTGTDEVDVTGTTPLVLGRWAHVAATFSAATKTFALFKDGVPAGTQTVAFDHVMATTGVPFTAGSLAISSAGTAAGRAPQSAIGYLDEVRLSNVVRYTAAFTPGTAFTSDASTLALYHFDETTGATASDASAAANAATLSGGATHFATCPAGCAQPAAIPAFTTGAWLICGATAGPNTWNGLMTFTSATPSCDGASPGASVGGTFQWTETAGGSIVGETRFVGTWASATEAISVDEVQVLSGGVVPAHDFMSYAPATDTLVDGGWNCPSCFTGMWSKAIHVADPATAACP